MHAGEGPPSSSALKALSSGAPLNDSFFYDFLDLFDKERRSPTRAAASPEQPGDSSSGERSDGAMMLPRKEQYIRVSSDRLSPAQFVLQPGGRVVIAVAQGGPQQAFSVGRDVEEAFVTPVIPPGSSYEWTPLEPGRYFVQSEVYPHLRSAVVVLQEEARETVTSVPPPGTSRRSSITLGGSARSSLGGEPSGSLVRTSSSSTASAAVDEYVSFPALVAARTGANRSRATQTAGGVSLGSVSRHTSTTGVPSSSAAAAVAPSAVLRRYALPAEDDADEGAESVPDSPPASGLRQRRPRSTSAPTASAAAAAAAKQQHGVHSVGALPPLSGRSMSAAQPGVDGFSVLSAGSGGSPRSGSGSERSASSTTLFVRRDKFGGMLQTTHAFASGRSAHSDSRSGGGSDETQPLLFDSRRGSGHLQAASFSSGGSYRPYSAAAPPAHVQRAADEDRAPKLHKCPRCRKEYLSTINQRRCISSHLRGASGASRRGSIPDSSQLATFWDGLEEGEKCAVVDLRTEHNGEHLMRQLEIQKLHRQRSGAMDQLTQEQKRLHASGMLLHSACGGRSGAAGAPAAIQSLTGAHLMRVLSEVSEGTFLFDRNPISQDEFSTGNNLEAGLGALVMKRLVDAHLAAKQRQADRLQRELEDQEAEQEARKAGKQQQAGAGGAQQQHAGGGKKKLKAKTKGKAAAPSVAAPAGTSAAASAAAAPHSSPASEVVATAPAVAAAAPQSETEQLQAAHAERAQEEAAATVSDILSPPRPGGEERYGSSPKKQKVGAPGSGSFTNFLFAEDGDAEGATGGRAAEANVWRTAGSSRATRSSQQGPKPAAGSRPQQPAVNAAKPAAKAGARSSSSAARLPERPGLRGAAERAPAQLVPAGPAKAVTTAAAASTGKLPAPSSRNSAAIVASAAPKPLSSKQQQAPRRDSFPALLKAAPAAAVPDPAALTASASYATAAKMHREGSGAKQLAAEQQPHPATLGPGVQGQQQQQAPAAELGFAQQPKSWPVPGAVAAVQPPASKAPTDAAPHPPKPEQQEQRARLPLHQGAPAAPQCMPVTEGSDQAPLQEAAAPAAEQQVDEPVPAPSDSASVAEEAQRCASVTPPISDAGSPPPGYAPGYPPGYPCWFVGPDGAPLPAQHFYWVPHPHPGMQFGVDPVEGGILPGAFPYPFYPPVPYPAVPPGHPASMAMPLPPHMLPYPGDGQLAPFPHGMPVPLPPEVATELAAVAAAARGQLDGSWSAAAFSDVATDAEGEEEQAQDDACTDGSSEQQATQPRQEQQAPKPPAVSHVQEQQQPGSSASQKSGFVEMLQQACGAQDSSAHGPAALAAATSSSRRRDSRQPSASFDAAAAAAELARRWQVAASQSVPASTLTTLGRSAAASACPHQRRSTGSTGAIPGAGSKPGKPSAGKAGSGRASPAPGSKPVVVAVRAFTSDDSAGGDGQGPKWRISTAPPPVRTLSRQQQHTQARHVHAGTH